MNTTEDFKTVETAREFLAGLCREIADSPTKVIVRAIRLSNLTVFKIACDIQDTGKIIGSHGACFRGLQHVMRRYGERWLGGMRLDIGQIENPPCEETHALKLSRDWDWQKWLDVMDEVIWQVIGEHETELEDSHNPLIVRYHIGPVPGIDRERMTAALNGIGSAIAKTYGGEAMLDLVED